jgi:hypothetical protein
MESLTTEQWADIDAHIFRGYLSAIVRIRQICGVGINEAKDIHWERYKRLRAERNAEFACTDAEYCAGILE